MTVAKPVRLSQLLRETTGHLDWAACRSVGVPNRYQTMISKTKLKPDWISRPGQSKLPPMPDFKPKPKGPESGMLSDTMQRLTRLLGVKWQIGEDEQGAAKQDGKRD